MIRFYGLDSVDGAQQEPDILRKAGFDERESDILISWYHEQKEPL